jgi:ketosteroid isomerase-like protein
MNLKLSIAALGACLLSLSAPAPVHAQAGAVDVKAEEAAVRAARITQTQALAKDDLDTVVKYWTPDITIRRALGQPVDSAAAARKLLEPAPGSNPAANANRIVYQRVPVSVDVSPNWPLAYEEGRWSGHIGSVDNKSVIGGRYSAQWVKRDGQWLIRSEVFVALSCADAGCKSVAVP